MTTAHAYCVFPCANCGVEILLPFAMLETPIASPGDPSTDFVAVAVSCPECKDVAMHQVKRRNSPLPAESGDRLEWLIRDGDYCFVASLQCAKEDCDTQLAVFAPRNGPMTDEEKAADRATWTWAGLRCPRGHAIPKPVKK
jgi:predicted RNA-binding Zn-ribbon protein involved in translation (DUF1610 family)